MEDIPNNSTKNNNNISHTSKKLNRAYLYKKIQEISPCSIYKLAKDVNEDYKTIWYAIRDMEFAGIIETRSETINGRECKIIFIPEYREGKNA